MIRIHFCRLFLVCLFIVQSVIAQTESYEPNKEYSVDTLKADLHYIRIKLEKIHPALYRYSTKPALDSFFDSLEHAIIRPMNEQQYFSILSLLHAKIKDGHTMFLPSDATMEYDNTHGRFFPFSVVYTGGGLYVSENCSLDTMVRVGDEILSINGTNISALMSQLISRQIRDGENQTYPEWILDHYFAAYYSFAFGQPVKFFMDFRRTSGEQYNEQIAAMTKDSVKYFRKIRYATHVQQARGEKGISLDQYNNSTAILKIKSFDPDLLNSLYQQNYKTTMESVFRRLKRNHTANLILDLRDNQGGDFPPARLLLSYLIIHPSRFLMSGSQSRLIQPNVNGFTGRIFVLMNGGSFSSTAILIVVLERDKRATTIGEETAGNKYVISGDPGEQVLPATRIRCFISTVTYRITEGINDGHGVLPAYPVHHAMEDLVMGNDISKSLALTLILNAK
jgi:hypothetical protein